MNSRKSDVPRNGYTFCPQCGVEVKEKNLAAHQERVHGVSPQVPDTEKGHDWTVAAAVAVVAILIVISIAAYSFLNGRSESGPEAQIMYPGDNVIRTTDGWGIACTCTPGSNASTAVVLIHGMNENRKVWSPLAADIRAATGYTTVTFDLRGHGESTVHNGNTETLSTFEESDFPSMIRDVDAVTDAMRAAGYRHFIFVGASIGANLALVYAAGHNDVLGVALLSPGNDYHGINGLSAAKEYGLRPAYIAVSKGDTYSNKSVAAMSALMPTAEIHIFDGSDHGTNLLNDGADGQITVWVSRFHRK